MIGAFATQPRFQGGGSSHINATRTDVALDEIRALAADQGSTVLAAQGFTLDTDASEGENAVSS